MFQYWNLPGTEFFAIFCRTSHQFESTSHDRHFGHWQPSVPHSYNPAPSSQQLPNKARADSLQHLSDLSTIVQMQACWPCCNWAWYSWMVACPWHIIAVMILWQPLLQWQPSPPTNENNHSPTLYDPVDFLVLNLVNHLSQVIHHIFTSEAAFM